MKENTGAACQVKRVGEVVKRDGSGLWIRVQGRVIPIAPNKADATLGIGDLAEWDGGKWIKAEIDPADDGEPR